MQRQIAYLRRIGVLVDGEMVFDVFEEFVSEQYVVRWLDDVDRHVDQIGGRVMIPNHSRDVYEEIATFLQSRTHPRLKSG